MTYEDIIQLNEATQPLKNKGVMVENLIKLIKLKSKLQTITGEYYEAVKVIMEEAAIPQEGGRYLIPATPEGTELTKKLEALSKTKVDETLLLNFLSEKEFHIITLDLDLATITFLAKWLLKPE